jgi:hypothetical protein
VNGSVESRRLSHLHRSEKRLQFASAHKPGKALSGSRGGVLFFSVLAASAARR